jgi:hypothetical protein
MHTAMELLPAESVLVEPWLSEVLVFWLSELVLPPSLELLQAARLNTMVMARSRDTNFFMIFFPFNAFFQKRCRPGGRPAP